jgi:hypothetical protein
MQNIKGAIVLILGIMFIGYACYYEYPPIPAPIAPEDVSFNTHILPLLVSKCSSPECHDGTKKPDLRAEHAYNALKSGGYYNTTFPEESKLYISVDEGIGGLQMPPSGPLSTLDKNLLLVWISKGAPND